MDKLMLARLALVAALWCIVPARAFGQAIPAGEDTLDARGYVPLQVGNVWEYYHTMTRPPTPETPVDHSEVRRERYELVDSLVRLDTVYFTLVFEEQSEGGALLRRDTALVWYEIQTASLGAIGYAGVFEELMCLDADFGSHDEIPLDYSPFVQAESLYMPQLFGDQIVAGKNFSSYVWSQTVVHNVGLVSRGGGCEPCDAFSSRDQWQLAFARVGENAYGDPVVNVGTMEDHAPRFPDSLAAWPNPSDGLITIQATAGEVVRVFDMLGRELANFDSAGEDQLDLAAFPPGLYLVTAGREATTVILF